MDKKKLITIIRRSCVNGKPVWIYQGPSRNAAHLAYWRACRNEIERVRNWSKTSQERLHAAEQLLIRCTGTHLTSALTPSQAAAARQLQKILKTGLPCHLDFYEHIMEERRRMKADREIRRQMRNREKIDNNGYDK